MMNDDVSFLSPKKFILIMPLHQIEIKQGSYSSKTPPKDPTITIQEIPRTLVKAHVERLP
jgi:hypothetical protein